MTTDMGGGHFIGGTTVLYMRLYEMTGTVNNPSVNTRTMFLDLIVGGTELYAKCSHVLLLAVSHG